MLVNVKKEFSASPVTIPGSAIGSTSRNEMRVPAEEAELVQGVGDGRAEDERDPGREQADLDRQQESRANGLVVPGDGEPVQCEALNRPALHSRWIKGVQHYESDRPEEECEHQGDPDPQPGLQRA